jgi:uncharacterized protein YggE
MNDCRARTIAGAALAVAILALLEARPAMAADADKAERTVSVSATGSVIAEPDVAYISAGVVTEAETAKAAIARNSAIMAKVIDGLKDAGIAAKDLQTTQIDVQPRYTQAKEGRPATISGYRVSNQVRVTVRDAKRTGEILDRAISLGANQIGQISFDVADSERLKDAARTRAMDNARRRAELYAKAAAAQLGPVLRIAEGSVLLDLTGGAAVRYAGHGVQIEPGTRRLEVQVSVVYALR